MMINQTNIKNNKGFALISALVVLAIVTGAAVAMAVKQSNGIELASNIIRYNEASNHGEGIFLWAEGVLKQDIKDNLADSFQDTWNQQLVDVEINGGQIDAVIVDLQSRFNINNLGLTGSEGDLARERFRRLLYLLNITTDFTDAVADWIDADSNTRFPNGAEDDYYLSIDEVSYRVANQSFSSVNELLLVKGVTLWAFEQLQPFVSVLEPGTGVNVNTASKEVLASLSNQMNGAAIDELIQIRQQNVITDLGPAAANENNELNTGNATNGSLGSNLNSRSNSKLAAPYNQLLTGDPACDAKIESHFFKDNACRNVSQRSDQYEKQCLASLEITRNDCLNFIPAQNPDASFDLSSTGVLSKYNINNNGLSVSSSFFDVIGKVEYFENIYTVNYRLKRNPNGQIELMSKKINGIKEIEEDESEVDI